LLEAAVEFAAENRHFDFAFELARNLDKTILQDVYYKQAIYFEDESKFKEAEIAFVQAGKPREAVLMHVQNENWKDAQTVAEAHDPSSVAEILAAQAKAAFAAKEYPKAETLLLRAHRPELMISMYKDGMMWKEALRFTREYLPARLNELHTEYDLYMSKSGSGKEEILTSARVLEQQAEYARAIEMYLKLTSATTERVADLEAAWGRALELTSKHYPDRLIETIQIVAARFHNMQYYEKAGQLYLSGHKYKDAADCFIAGAFWDQARVVVKKDPTLKEYVENSYMKFLKSKGQIDALADLDIDSALDIMVQRGEWEKCLEKAASTNSKDLLNKYLVEYMIKNVKNGQIDKALELSSKYGVPVALSNFDVYESIAVTKLKSHELSMEMLKQLRNLLYTLVGSTILNIVIL
jgi:intraflagellar transport protein 172